MIEVDYINSKNYIDYVGKTISVKGYVDIDSCNLVGKLPIKFVRVGSYFDCRGNNLTSLNGAPKKVGGDFDCTNNFLKDFEGSPEFIGGLLCCKGNPLIELKGSPRYLGGGLYCDYNDFITKECVDIFKERCRKLRILFDRENA